MARWCPVIQNNVVYLECMDCDEDCRCAGKPPLPAPVRRRPDVKHSMVVRQKTRHLPKQKVK